MTSALSAATSGWHRCRQRRALQPGRFGQRPLSRLHGRSPSSAEIVGDIAHDACGLPFDAVAVVVELRRLHAEQASDAAHAGMGAGFPKTGSKR